MKYLFRLFLFLCLASSFACEEDVEGTPQIPLTETITGEWLVVYKKHKANNFMFEEPAKGVVTEWNCYYVLSLRVNADHTYYINDSEEELTSNGQRLAVGGQWSLDEHNTITFNCSDSAKTSFSAYMNKAGQLVFENDEVVIRHNRKP
jgi:hypothetical protein